MKEKKVKNYMISVKNYPTLHQNSTLLEAMEVLKKSQEKVPKDMQPFRAVLVVDDNNKIVGKVGHHGFLQALEPKYNSIQDFDKLAQANLNPEFIKLMMNNFNLWQDNIFDVRTIAKTVQLKDIMPPIIEHIDQEASLVEAIHKIIMWQRLSLLVTHGNDIVGILRLSDLYAEVRNYIQEESKSD